MEIRFGLKRLVLVIILILVAVWVSVAMAVPRTSISVQEKTGVIEYGGK